MTITIDKEFKSLIPPLTSEEYSGLEASVKESGCRIPLDIWNGVVVDGHNRYEICTRHNISFKTKDIIFKDRTEAVLWIIGNQLNRRNLQSIDRIALVNKQDTITTAIREKAKESQISALKQNKSVPQKSSERTDIPQKSAGSLKPNFTPQKSAAQKIESRKEIAKLAGVSHDTYKKGVEILQKADPKVIEDMRAKKQSINAVYKEMKQAETTVKRVEARKEAAVKIKAINKSIIVGDFRKKMNEVPDNSLSLIFTDPPYNQKAKELFPEIGEFARKKLITGGSLICYVGQLQLSAAMASLDNQLRYWWTLCCLHSGAKTLIREYGVRNGWKPVLWYVKDTRENPESIIQDVISGGREKTEHEWQQATSEAEYCIENLCPRDGIVCDLFLGSGTTAIAANKLKRHWIGFEIDEDTAKIASERIGQ